MEPPKPTTTRDPSTWKPFNVTEAPPPMFPEKVYYEAWKFGTRKPRLFDEKAVVSLKV